MSPDSEDGNYFFIAQIDSFVSQIISRTSSIMFFAWNSFSSVTKGIFAGVLLKDMDVLIQSTGNDQF